MKASCLWELCMFLPEKGQNILKTDLFMVILMDDCLHYGRSTQMHLEAGGLQPAVTDSGAAVGIAQVP